MSFLGPYALSCFIQRTTSQMYPNVRVVLEMPTLNTSSPTPRMSPQHAVSQALRSPVPPHRLPTLAAECCSLPTMQLHVAAATPAALRNAWPLAPHISCLHVDAASDAPATDSLLACAAQTLPGLQELRLVDSAHTGAVVPGTGAWGAARGNVRGGGARGGGHQFTAPGLAVLLRTCPSVAVLDISGHRQLRELPVEIANLTNLRELR